MLLQLKGHPVTGHNIRVLKKNIANDLGTLTYVVR